MYRARRSWLPLAVAMLAAVAVLPALTGTVDAATSRWTAKCSTNIRTKPWKSAAVLRIIPSGTVVTATAAVSGGSWQASCGGNVSGRSWLKITAVNGRSTSSLFGRGAVYAAKGLFRLNQTTTTTTPTAKDYASNCSVRLRSSASTRAGTRAIIDANSIVTAVGTVSGSAWAADCGTNVAGRTWLKVTAVGGRSVSSLYGVSAVYAASGLFRVLSTTNGWIEGIDVSKWQGVIDWSTVAAAGKRFAIAKATEGIGYEDPSYDRNKAGAQANGLAFGAYHFARPGTGNDPVREADWFLDRAGYQRGMLIPALDLEATGGLGPTALTGWVKAWLGRVYGRLGVKPMIYTSPSFWRNNMNDTSWFADNGYGILWVAHWKVATPSVPASNWGGRSWTFWQYSSEGHVPGIEGRVDLNRYRFPTFNAVTY